MRAILIFIVAIGMKSFYLHSVKLYHDLLKIKKLFHKIFIVGVMIEKVFVENQVILLDLTWHLELVQCHIVRVFTLVSPI